MDGNNELLSSSKVCFLLLGQPLLVRPGSGVYPGFPFIFLRKRGSEKVY